MSTLQFVFTEAGSTPSGQQLVDITIPDERGELPIQHAGRLCMWPHQWRSLRLRLRHLPEVTVRP